MKKILKITIILILFFNNYTFSIDRILTINSPSKNILVELYLTSSGIPAYKVYHNNIEILELSLLGVKRADADFSKNLSLAGISDPKEIKEEYSLITGKKRYCVHHSFERAVLFKNINDECFEIIFRVSDDGVAFRYHFPEKIDKKVLIIGENTTFNFNRDTKAWLHPHCNAQTGWANTQPSYEEYYFQEVAVGTLSPFEGGWSFPALFKTNNTWILITETALTPDYCGTRLAQYSPDGEYSIAFPQSGERISSKDSYLPLISLPFYTPWRLLIIGTLKTIVESTLVTDLAKLPEQNDYSYVKPGRSSWSWVLLKDDSTVYEVQKKFIDYASSMGWEYCLIDADWDKKIGFEKIKELVEYAKSKNVGILLWYNSSGSWNTTTYSPKNIMNKPEERKLEMEKISKIGVKGIKVDFWGGDGQSMIQYYFDLFKDAHEHKLMVNCHGTTIPRGWERTFPNLVSMESVRGFEFVTFAQENADSAPRHCTILPFTRNTIGPMDFTPVCFSEVPNIKRKTSNAFELALSVIFYSGIQHYAEIPSGMYKQPQYIIDFMKNVPVCWEETKFIDGYPGNYVVLARKGNNKWYIAGINALKNDISLQIDLLSLPISTKGILITDGDNDRSFSKNAITITKNVLNITIKPNGGFVAIFDDKKK